MSEEEIMEYDFKRIKQTFENTEFAYRYTTALQLPFNYILDMKILIDMVDKEKEKNKKWEDKIKAKIEELKYREENVVQYTDNKVILYAIQKVLQELLEEKE